MAYHFLDPEEFRPGGLTQAMLSLRKSLACADQPSAEVLIAVGWHTPAERALQKAVASQSRLLWSHGLGTLTFYRGRPFLGLLRLLSRFPQLFSVLATLKQCNRLVVAYPRRNPWDERSFDVTLARYLRVPVEVIGNPIDTDLWRPSVIRSDFDSAHVVSVGRLEWQKGHAQALAIVISVSSDICLQVLAPESSAYAKMLKRKADLVGHSQQLQLLYGLASEQRREVLQRALCMLSWSETEYQSLAMLEALACGCPVIARPRGWLCHAPVPGVLIAHSHRQARRYLQQLKKQPTWREELAKAGRAYVVQHHALAVVARQWNRMFAELS